MPKADTAYHNLHLFIDFVRNQIAVAILLLLFFVISSTFSMVFIHFFRFLLVFAMNTNMILLWFIEKFPSTASMKPKHFRHDGYRINRTCYADIKHFQMVILLTAQNVAIGSYTFGEWMKSLKSKNHDQLENWGFLDHLKMFIKNHNLFVMFCTTELTFLFLDRPRKSETTIHSIDS